MPDYLPPPPWAGPPIPEAFLRAFNLTPERIALLQSINSQIRQRTRYGYRKETVEKVPAYILHWSNSNTEWWIFTSVRRRGIETTLDANQILVQGVKASDLNPILRWLEPLPLYSFSFEAKALGIYDPLGHLRALLEEWLEEH